MKVAFYLKNSRISNVDCREISLGNPGIGGTFFSMISLIHNLIKEENTEFEFYTYAESTQLLPDNIKAFKISSEQVLPALLVQDNIDILVLNRINELDASAKFFNLINSTSTKVIIWAHCFIPPKMLKLYASNKQVSKIVCVGKEQQGLLVDHPIYKKSTYIFNGFDFSGMKSYEPKALRSNSVTYIGSIIPQKGFHILAKAWKSVLKEIPDAELNVIGSGKLYSRDSNLGPYGIADFFYEKSFIKYLLDENKEIHESVNFLGILGAEKNDVLKKTKVGVPNPSGISETFGYTAIEMQAFGCKIVTKNCPGYCDTVYPKNGTLIDSTDDLGAAIIKMLKKDENHYLETQIFLKENFSFNVITREWFRLFSDVMLDNPENLNPIIYKYKKGRVFRKVNLHIRRILPFIPTYTFYQYLLIDFNRLKKAVSSPIISIQKLYRRLF